MITLGVLGRRWSGRAGVGLEIPMDVRGEGIECDQVGCRTYFGF